MFKTKAANRYSCFGNNILLFKKMNMLLFALAIFGIDLLARIDKKTPWNDEAEVSDTTMLR